MSADSKGWPTNADDGPSQLTTQTRLRYSSTMMSNDFLAAISLSSLSIVNTRFWIVLFSCRRSFVHAGIHQRSQAVCERGTVRFCWRQSTTHTRAFIKYKCALALSPLLSKTLLPAHAGSCVAYNSHVCVQRSVPQPSLFGLRHQEKKKTPMLGQKTHHTRVLQHTRPCAASNDNGAKLTCNMVRCSLPSGSSPFR